MLKSVYSRIFYFYNNGMEEIYMGSADWMPRNLDRRVEIIFPVEDEETKVMAQHILEVQMSDNEKAYYLNANGEYERLDKRGKTLYCAQEIFMEEARAKKPVEDKGFMGRRFIPKLAMEDE